MKKWCLLCGKVRAETIQALAFLTEMTFAGLEGESRTIARRISAISVTSADDSPHTSFGGDYSYRDQNSTASSYHNSSAPARPRPSLQQSRTSLESRPRNCRRLGERHGKKSRKYKAYGRYIQRQAANSSHRPPAQRWNQEERGQAGKVVVADRAREFTFRNHFADDV
jgi:hypothetical protein